MSESASMRLPLHEDDAGRSLSRETVPGGSAQERWVPVRKTVGLLNARIIADSLIAAEIPARAWQEGAGQAYGLTVGVLGTGYVMVLESMVDLARDYLDTLEELDAEE